MKTCRTCGSKHGDELTVCGKGHLLFSDAGDDSLIGQVLDGRYEVAAKLGGGGFGMVYLASQLRLGGRPCAVKVARPELASDKAFAARFEREKKALMALRSPNTVQIIDYGRTDTGVDYIVMEFIEGRPLDKMLRTTGRLPLSRALQLAAGVARSLEEAHGLGILHRDLKPANVIVVDIGTAEVAKVIDFGIARLADSSDATFHTRTGELPGTPLYASPEQLAGRTDQVDHRTDIYSLGAMIYEMIAGSAPFGDRFRPRDFDSSTLYFLALASAKTTQTATPVGKLAREPLDPALEQLIMSLIEPASGKRPGSASEVRAKLEQAAFRLSGGRLDTQETVTAPPPEGAPSDGRWAMDDGRQPSSHGGEPAFGLDATLESAPDIAGPQPPSSSGGAGQATPSRGRALPSSGMLAGDEQQSDVAPRTEPTRPAVVPQPVSRRKLLVGGGVGAGVAALAVVGLSFALGWFDKERDTGKQEEMAAASQPLPRGDGTVQEVAASPGTLQAIPAPSLAAPPKSGTDPAQEQIEDPKSKIENLEKPDVAAQPHVASAHPDTTSAPEEIENPKSKIENVQELVLLKLEPDPPADITVGGEDKGRSPVEVVLTKGGPEVEVVAKRRGYEDESFKFTPKDDYRWAPDLRKERSASAHKKEDAKKKDGESGGKAAEEKEEKKPPVEEKKTEGENGGSEETPLHKKLKFMSDDGE